MTTSRPHGVTAVSALESHGLLVPAGQLRSSTGSALAIDGLWALEFGQGRPTTAHPTRCSSPPDPTTRRMVCSAPSVRPRPSHATRRGAGGAAGGPRERTASAGNPPAAPRAPEGPPASGPD